MQAAKAVATALTGRCLRDRRYHTGDAQVAGKSATGRAESGAVLVGRGHHAAPLIKQSPTLPRSSRKQPQLWRSHPSHMGSGLAGHHAVGKAMTLKLCGRTWRLHGSRSKRSRLQAPRLAQDGMLRATTLCRWTAWKGASSRHRALMSWGNAWRMRKRRWLSGKGFPRPLATSSQISKSGVQAHGPRSRNYLASGARPSHGFGASKELRRRRLERRKPRQRHRRKWTRCSRSKWHWRSGSRPNGQTSRKHGPLTRGPLATVASIRAEAAAQDNEPGQQGNAATADGSSLSGDVVKAVLGLVHQLNELPKAAAAGNLEDAIRAALGQAKLLLPLETGETATPTVGAAACAGHIGGAAARPPVPLPLRPRANRATSPAAVSCDSDSEEERRRSRSRERKEKEREKTVRDVVEGRQRTINDALVRGAA